MECSRKRAFTVVELLVVIGILSVLAALLLPTLERSLDASRQMACMGLSLRHQAAPPFVPGPDPSFVCAPSFGGCQFLWVELSPQAVHVASECGDAAFGGHASPAEDQQVPCFAQGFQQCIRNLICR